jgi:pheromone a factor receptor
VLCINRRLANIATSPNIVTSHRRKRVDLAIDIILCTAVPALAMVCAFVVQPHRANILEGYGCLYPVWSSWLAVILVYVWPPIISLVSAVYGGKYKHSKLRNIAEKVSVIAIRFFLSRRLQFQSLLKSSHSGLDTSQYLRLICLAGTELVIALPLNLWVLAANASTLQPWTSWYEVHYNWSNVISIPASYITQAPSLAVSNAVPRYLVTVSSIVFFIFFGVSEDAIGEYTRWGRRASMGLARIRSGRQQS